MFPPFLPSSRLPSHFFPEGQLPRVLTWLGLVATFLYAAGHIVWPAVGQQAGTLMALLGLFAVLCWGRELRASAPLWLLLAIILVQLLSWVLGYLHHPQWVPDNPELDRMAKWFLFIGMAWWLGGSSRLTLWVWAIAVPGWLLAVWLEGHGWQSWQRGLAGQRVDFGIHNAQHVAMLFGAAALGLASFAPRMLRAGRLAWGRRLAWGIMALVCLAGVVVTQTRGVWLAFSAAALGMLGGWAWRAWQLSGSAQGATRRGVAAAIGALLVIGVLAAAFHDTVERRVMAEREVIASVIQGDWSGVPYSSVGIRIHSWRAATEWIAERPLVGWGGEGRSLVMEQTEWLPDSVSQRFGHLHNTVLEVLVGYGLLGASVVALLAIWVARGTWLAWRGGALPGDVALFGAGFFVFFMIANLFESYLAFWSGGYVFTLVMGGLVTHIWRWQRATGSSVFGWRREGR
ncbi:O-antigen ligase family protein [Chromohalobacter sp. 48-RD10]|uniref:O-antigen ligase family protein n=1 Tax=Chromohalobacter sp. 48-RD10 TaxID=2994063 RepID=UPI00246865E8|nr:O-antigen ligase family protein [Chromohalobacter sp. 48-RD10]